MTYRERRVRGGAAVLCGMALCAMLALACVLAPRVYAVNQSGVWGARETGDVSPQASLPEEGGAGQVAAGHVLTGETDAPAAGQAASAPDGPELRIGFSTSSLPYVDVAHKGGLEPLLVTAALGKSGYRVVPVFLPHARALDQVRKGLLDGCGPVGRHADVAGLALGGMYLQYRNVAVSLEAANLDINTLGDLRDLPVTAFHNARVFMGPDFAAMADANPRYEEQVDQRAQVEAFFQRRDRVIVLDERILAFHRARLAARGVGKPVRIHHIFPAQDRFFVFRDPAVRNAFDAGLRQLRESGEYRRMVR
ncbi:substrate-binding periplasmic protein [Nitratidesulfovibrio termitidis]|uniref:substrate-binding periplasmic protein n=1 Tax=Nitratidesulfovibrio termitidis TaxID=42252 RepID=UPI00055511A8|nr:hypothetical protein [Nitratidesulfovibrio termitidis]